eukprot:jgi/Mesen1/8706/ME000052S08132
MPDFNVSAEGLSAYFTTMTVPNGQQLSTTEIPSDASFVASVSILTQLMMLAITFIAGYILRRKKIVIIHEAAIGLGFGVLIGLLVKLLRHHSEFRYAVGQLQWAHSMPLLVAIAFGALISATDPVTVLAIFHELGVDGNLYSFVFGESVLNDAVAIVMYRTVLSFINSPGGGGGILGALWFFIVIFVGSFSIGVMWGLLSALLFKHGQFEDKSLSMLQSCLVVLFPYMAYMMADALELSGIVAILFSGITMKYYVAPNLSEKAKEITGSFFGMLAKLSETFVFIYMGVAMFLEQQSWHDYNFTFFTILSIFLARVLNVFPLSYIVNRFRPAERQIPLSHQIALWFGGLRGAMAFALALQSVADLPDNHGRVLLTSSLFTILFTVSLCLQSRVNLQQPAVVGERWELSLPACKWQSINQARLSSRVPPPLFPILVVNCGLALDIEG